MNNSRFKKLAILIAVGLVLLLGFTIYRMTENAKKTATITMTVVPQDSTITLNGKRAQGGGRDIANKVKPGTYTVVVSRKGFATFTKQVTATKGNKTAFATALIANSPDTQNWYSTHPEDKGIAEGISGRQYDAIIKKQVDTTPFIKELPFIAPGFEFRVDYASDPNDPNKTVIHVSADTEEAKQDALAWIKSVGYNPDDLTIVYEKINN